MKRERKRLDKEGGKRQRGLSRVGRKERATNFGIALLVPKFFVAW